MHVISSSLHISIRTIFNVNEHSLIGESEYSMALDRSSAPRQLLVCPTRAIINGHPGNSITGPLFQLDINEARAWLRYGVLSLVSQHPV